jgi:hypothetical protein
MFPTLGILAVLGARSGTGTFKNINVAAQFFSVTAKFLLRKMVPFSEKPLFSQKFFFPQKVCVFDNFFVKSVCCRQASCFFPSKRFVRKHLTCFF